MTHVDNTHWSYYFSNDFIQKIAMTYKKTLYRKLNGKNK